VAPSGSATVTFNSGTIGSVNATINNGAPFTIGDSGGSSATYRMKKDVAGNHGTHTFADGLVLSSNAILKGNGDIVGDVSGSAGAQVDVGDSAGVINVTGDWDNTGLALALELGNLAATFAAGGDYNNNGCVDAADYTVWRDNLGTMNELPNDPIGETIGPAQYDQWVENFGFLTVGQAVFDLLDITGQFTHGGTVTIDVSQYVAPSAAEQIKVIGWTSEAGSSGDTTVSFIGGDPLAYAFQSDGLYLSVGAEGAIAAAAVPEPAVWVLWMQLATAWAFARHRHLALSTGTVIGRN